MLGLRSECEPGLQVGELGLHQGQLLLEITAEQVAGQHHAEDGAADGHHLGLVGGSAGALGNQVSDKSDRGHGEVSERGTQFRHRRD